MKNPKTARLAAYEILLKIYKSKAYSTILLNSYFNENDLSNEDKALAANIVYTTLQNNIKINYIIDFFVKKKMDMSAKIILEIAICQLEFLDKIPTYAAVNESCSLTRIIKKPYLSGFINGVLREYLRQKDSIKYDFNTKEEYLSVMYSYPLWMVKRFAGYYDNIEEILKSAKEPALFTLRANTLKTNADFLITELEKSRNIKAEKGKLCENAIVCSEGFAQQNDELFLKGFYYSQSQSSMLVSKVLNPEKGQTVIDICAAPGGKTTHIAELMDNEGKIIAFDLYEHKIKLINDNAKRLDINIINAKMQDSLKINEKLLNTADRVLADVPCSGTGVIRRKPEIKLTKTKEDIENLAKMQLKLINNASKYVKKGGFLVYSTCSIDKEENEEVIKKFLEESKNFKLYDFSEFLPQNMKEYGKKGYITVFPEKCGIDGFFIAKFMRIS